MSKVPSPTSSEQGSRSPEPSLLVTPLLAPEYTEFLELTGTISYWAILRTTIEKLEKLGLRPPPQSRLRQALQALEVPAADLSDATLRCALEAYRIALEFWTISRTLTPRLVAISRVKKLLQRAYMGKLDPATADQTSERARDAQFELWLGSWFAMGGRPVRAEEPDLRATLWFHWYGVAAKRVRSRKQVLKRVQYAADQIRASGDRGLIAISLDNYTDRSVRLAAGVEPGNEFFAAFPEIDAAELWLIRNAPLVKGTLCFGLLTSWGSLEGAHPSIDMSALERVVLLNSDPTEQQDITDVLQESRVLRRRRWSELLRFAKPSGL